VNNPFNPDVRGVPVERIRELFPQGEMRVRRLTLAPPLARVVTRIHPELYTALNICGWLRTHVLVWVEKPLAVCLYLIADAPGLPVALSYV
jgi:hypothetical protein